MEELTPNKNVPLPDPWLSLREFTSSRIALGRTGHSIPMKASLHFKLSHAHARDAVYSSLNSAGLEARLEKYELPVVALHSRVTSRQEYLTRPDLGRRLNEDSLQSLSAYASSLKSDVAICLVDGLSATAIDDQSIPLLDVLIPLLNAVPLRIAPLTIVEQGRVAIGDEIGHLFGARLVLVLIGERPGLSSPNSMGAYLTYAPAVGLTDESRNCVSNIRPAGLSYAEAARKIFYLIQESLKRNLSGIQLKEESGSTNRLE